MRVSATSAAIVDGQSHKLVVMLKVDGSEYSLSRDEAGSLAEQLLSAWRITAPNADKGQLSSELPFWTEATR